jgi:glycosyltransferase involved in cell wall biosynthesis
MNSVNADDDRRLNILTINNHEVYQAMLALTGHNFMFLRPPGSDQWSTAIRPISENCIELACGGDVNAQVPSDMPIDIVLCQNRESHYRLLASLSLQLAAPIVGFDYMLTAPDANPYAVDNLTFQVYNANMFTSIFLANSWGADEEDGDVAIVPPYIDPTLFCGWRGTNDKVLAVARHYEERQSLGFDMFQKATDGIPVEIVGPSRTRKTLSVTNLVDKYKNTGVFVNTTEWHACPLPLLEAMCTGCPVVSTSSTIIGDIIVDGENGMLADDPDEMQAKIREVLGDKALAKRLGDAARETIVQQFGRDAFVDNVNNIFRGVVGRSTALIGAKT